VVKRWNWRQPDPHAPGCPGAHNLPQSAGRRGPDFLAGGDFGVGHHRLDLAACFPGGLALLAFELGEFAVFRPGFGCLALLGFAGIERRLFGLFAALFGVCFLLQFPYGEDFGIALGAGGCLFLPDRRRLASSSLVAVLPGCAPLSPPAVPSCERCGRAMALRMMPEPPSAVCVSPVACGWASGEAWEWDDRTRPLALASMGSAMASAMSVVSRPILFMYSPGIGRLQMRGDSI